MRAFYSKRSLRAATPMGGRRRAVLEGPVILRDALLFLAAFVAGAINAVAGGGTLVTFPALLAAGLSPIGANATSTVALVPGSFGGAWGYRGQLRGDRRLLAVLAVPSLAGGALGAWLLDRTGDATF